MNLFFLIVACLASLSAAVFWLVRRNEWTKEPYFYFRCPSCAQKLRFLSRLAGCVATCPNCKKSAILPKASNLSSEQMTGKEGYRVKRALAKSA